MTEEKYLSYLCLKSAKDLNLKTCLELLSLYPDPQSFVGVPEHPVYHQGILKQDAIKHLQSFTLPANTAQILALMKQYEIKCLAMPEDDYPACLREIFAPPLLLYVRGDLKQSLENRRLAVVGTRKASSYGREMCKKLLSPLCKMGLNIVSGLALGIDTVAHHVALDNGARTIAALACGLESTYPAQNTQLAKDIIKQGALISEYEPGSKPEKWNFPARNRLISALSEAVFIVEGPITSGALLTAKNAIEQNRDICALPGNINNINATGPNHLIKHGAALISSSDDLFELLDMKPEKAEQLEIFPSLCPDEERIVNLLQEEQRALSFDELLIMCKFPVGRLSTHLTNLEIKGIIAKESGNSFFIR